MDPQTITFTAGDNYTSDVLLSWNGAVFDLATASTALLTVKRNVRDADVDALVQKALGAGITAGAVGHASVAFVHADTVALGSGVAFVFDLQAQMPNGEVRTVATGTLKLAGDVTREVTSSVPIYTTTPGQAYETPAGATAKAAAAVAGAPKGNVWQRKGIIITDPTGVAVNAESNVIYEGNSLLLGLSAAEPVFKLWYSGGNTGTAVGAGDSAGMYYAESRNGFENWVAHPTPVVSPNYRSSVVKTGGTYYIYALPFGKRFASADGRTFGSAQQLYFTGPQGAWEASGLQNSCVWVEGSTWYCMYEACANTGHVWQIGLMTSTDGINWVRYSDSPVIPAGDGLNSTSGPDVHKIGDTYWCWGHGVATNTNLSSDSVPTDLFRWKSKDLHTWERSPRYPIMVRATPDEGANNELGQIADVSLIEAAGRVFMFYEGADGSVLEFRNSSLKCAIANMTMAELVTTNEGDAGGGEQHYKDYYGAVHYPEQVVFGSKTGQFYERVLVKTTAAAARGMTLDHGGSLTALTIISGYPCPCNLEIGAGANYKAPIKLNSGAVLSTPVAGCIEFDGTNLFFTTNAGMRKTITAT